MIESPCILVCSIDMKTGFCFGCGRTREEIGYWSMISPERRREVMAELPGAAGRRRAQATARDKARADGAAGARRGRHEPDADPHSRARSAQRWSCCLSTMSAATTFGMDNDAFARLAMLGVLGAVLAAGVLRRGMRFAGHGAAGHRLACAADGAGRRLSIPV